LRLALVLALGTLALPACFGVRTVDEDAPDGGGGSGGTTAGSGGAAAGTGGRAAGTGGGAPTGSGGRATGTGGGAPTGSGGRATGTGGGAPTGSGGATPTVPVLVMEYRYDTLADIGGDFRVAHQGGPAVAISQITWRYYFTRITGGPQTINEYYCRIVYPNNCMVRPQISVVPLVPARPMADHYIEVRYSGPEVLPAGATYEVQFSSGALSGSPQTDDYSFREIMGEFAPNDKITIYIGSTRVWGIEP
jgi:hypothetical protein